MLKFSVSSLAILNVFQLIALSVVDVMVAPFATVEKSVLPPMFTSPDCTTPPVGMASAELVSASVISAARLPRRMFFLRFIPFLPFPC